MLSVDVGQMGSKLLKQGNRDRTAAHEGAGLTARENFALDATGSVDLPPAELIVRELTKDADPPGVVKVPPSVRKRTSPVCGLYSKSGFPSPGVPPGCA